MITKKERTQMRKILTSKWIPEVIKRLEDKNVLNKKGEPFTKGFISHVFNGKNENTIIEDLIIELYQERKQKQSKMRDERRIKLEMFK